ncbi:MAG: peptidoglycan DD-metalloendopeptidase family protein [Deltaproteobacteria bacterium]|jgi:murein DD-endopeptidase MepM/ murein hydrolase activator NlpD|nr:peptidoglycan DD-metalloendopeptidase family protein [Deltaproteobacteria bacterium]
MLFGKYDIVIFKEGRSGSHNVRLRGWLGIISFVFAALLIVCNLWLWDRYHQSLKLESRLLEAEKTIDEQSTQLLSMIGKVREVASDLTRVRQFDAKLRLMMNLDSELTDVGNPNAGDERGALPLHRQALAARKMYAFLRQLADDMRLEEVTQQELLRVLRENRDAIASLPTIWPVDGFISSPFGVRSSSFSGRSEFHKGLDIRARIGTPITAPGRGVVSMAGGDGAYGLSVELQHSRAITTKYGHMQRIVVREGQQVKRGDVIGFVGSTGRSTGPHLHYEVKLNGVQVNPMRYILN